MDRWDRIEEVLNRALDLEGDSRTSFLAAIEENEPELYRNVRELLESIEKAEDTLFLESGSSENDQLFEEINRSAREDRPHMAIKRLIGTHIGAFTLTEFLGRGGMAVVYKGERRDGSFNQTVAVKILNKNFYSNESINRFRAEQEILSKLNHPHIAHLIDGGISDEGNPYLVIEYVDGIPITEYVRTNNASLETRISIFKDLCLAVNYAHRNLVVHRDLKPDNILVTGEGRVKVLDFSIAKLLDPDFSSQPIVQTRTGINLLSPSYCAPEQFRNEPITTSADIFALGLLLYELLTEQQAVPARGRTMTEIEHAICETDFIKKWATDTSLDSDLKSIIAKAVRREPEFRYDSAGQMLEDVNRYEKSLPLIAQNDTMHYRMSKFIKRNKKGMVTALLILAVVGSLGWYHLHQVTKQRDIAEQEQVKAEAIKSFLVSLFNASNPLFPQVDGSALSARDLLDRGLASANRTNVGRPEVRIEILRTIGNAYNELGFYDKAAKSFHTSLQLGKRYYGAGAPELIGIYLDLADLYTNRNQFEKADSLAGRAYDIVQSYGLEKEREAGDVLAYRGYIAGHKTDYAQARKLYLQALAIYDERGLSKSLSAIDTRSNLADVNVFLGNLEEAEEYQKKAVAYYAEHFGTNHIKLARAVGSLAGVYYRQSKFDEALQANSRSLKLKEQILGPRHHDLAQAYSMQSLILLKIGRYEEAEKAVTKGIAIYAEKSPGSLEHAFALNNLAVIKKYQGAHRQALKLYERVYQLKLEKLGREAPATAVSMYNLADLYLTLGQYGKALDYARQVVRIDRRNLGKTHPEVGVDMMKVAVIYREMGNRTQASEYFTGAKAIMEQTYSPDHYRLGEWNLEYGQLLLEQQPAEAVEHLNRALDIQKQNYDPDDTRIAESLFYLGLAHRLLENEKKSKRFLQESNAIVQNKPQREVPFWDELQQTIAGE